VSHSRGGSDVGHDEYRSQSRSSHPAKKPDHREWGHRHDRREHGPPRYFIVVKDARKRSGGFRALYELETVEFANLTIKRGRQHDRVFIGTNVRGRGAQEDGKLPAALPLEGFLEWICHLTERHQSLIWALLRCGISARPARGEPIPIEFEINPIQQLERVKLYQKIDSETATANVSMQS
jgi:hypothetical protein